jgi:hypothetical protein
MFEQKFSTKGAHVSNFLSRGPNANFDIDKDPVAWIYGTYLPKDRGEERLSYKSHKTPVTPFLLGGLR